MPGEFGRAPRPIVFLGSKTLFIRPASFLSHVLLQSHQKSLRSKIICSPQRRFRLDRSVSIPWAEELLMLEDDIRETLARHVQRELDNEYQSKQRNKAAKLPKSAWEDLAISGEQLRALIREGAQVFRVDMTFPLFDLDSDFTLIRCSCSRDAVSLEALRCHHMFFLQKALGESLTALATPPAESFESVLPSPDLFTDEVYASEDYLWERRWSLRLDRQSWKALVLKERRLRYEPTAVWESDGALLWAEIVTSLRSDQAFMEALASGKGDERAELFCLLEQGSLPLSDAKTGREIRVHPARGTLELLEEGSRDRLSYSLGGKQQKDLAYIPGHGYLAAGEAEAHELVFLARLDPREENFLKKLAAQEGWSFPRDQRERVLRGLDKLDSQLFAAAAVAEDSLLQKVAKPQLLLRLTPFVRGGMRVEVRVKIAPHLSLVPGEGDEHYRDLRAGSRILWQRDLQEERSLARQWIRRLDLELLPEPESQLFIAYNDQVALDLIQRLEDLGDERAALLVEWPESLPQKPYEIADKIDAEQMSVRLGESRDWFQLDGWLALEDGRKLELKEVLNLLRRQQRYIQLADGRWALLSDHFRQKLEGLLRVVDIEDEELTLSLSALGSDEGLETLAQFPFAEHSKRFWAQVQTAKRAQTLPAELPEGLQAQLRSYQLDGYRWMHRLYESQLGACLADDMGLGKTLQTLTLLLAKASAGPSLVIAPSSLSYNWASEAARFCPALEIVQLRELQDRGQNQEFRAGQLVIASYGLLLRYGTVLAKVKWNILVFDEAQYVKNAQTKTARAAHELDAHWKLALSGTPIENRLSELWALFRVISPGLFGEWERFRNSYVFPIERDRKPEAQERLKRKLAPFILRRLKRDYLAELPEKTELDLWIDLSPDEREAYDALRGEALDKIAALEGLEAAELGQQKIQVLAALTRLRQAACHRQLIDPDWKGSATKIEFLRDKVSELKESGHAVLVFSQFTRFLQEIKTVLEADGVVTHYLDGQTPPPRRQELVESFQKGEGDVFLISLKAGGTGLNLTRASYVFHMDPWWNPAVEQQATDRAYRMGQKQAVTVYRLRARDSIEEVIHALHGEKRELMEGILEGRDPAAVWSWELVWNMLTTRSEDSQKKKTAPSRAVSAHRTTWEDLREQL